MRLGLFALLAFLVAANAAAQTTIPAPDRAAQPRMHGMAVDPPPRPLPEDGMNAQQRWDYWTRTALDRRADPQERERVFRRLLYTAQFASNDLDGAIAARWQEGWRDFVFEQERDILAQWRRSPPATPGVCDPTGQTIGDWAAIRRACGARDPRETWPFVWQNRMMAQAAELRGDARLKLHYDEIALLAQQAGLASLTEIVRLATQARKAGLLDEAARLCALLTDAPLYRTYMGNASATGVQCKADLAFDQGHWSDWLAYYEPRITGANGHDPAPVARFCVAATRANRHDIATRACDWAERSFAAQDAEEIHYGEQTATEMRQRAASAPNDGLRTRMLARADNVLTEWRGQKAQFDTLLAACRAARTTPDATDATSCGNVPSVEFILRGNDAMQAIQDSLRILHEQQGAPPQQRP